MAQKKVEDLQILIIEKEKEIEQYKYKLKHKTDELERERIDRENEVSLLNQEIENLKYMKTAALNQFDERNELVKQLEILKAVSCAYFFTAWFSMLILTVYWQSVLFRNVMTIDCRSLQSGIFY